VSSWDQLYGDLKRRGWIIFLVLASAAYFFMSRSFTFGLIMGGIIVIINFNFLQSTMIKAFQNTPALKKKKFLLIIKSLLRLFLLGIIILALLKYKLADPVGLAVGLSIIFFSIVSLGISSILKTGNRRVF
jgi:hypothetical protein